MAQWESVGLRSAYILAKWTSYFFFGEAVNALWSLLGFPLYIFIRNTALGGLRTGEILLRSCTWCGFSAGTLYRIFRNYMIFIAVQLLLLKGKF